MANTIPVGHGFGPPNEVFVLLRSGAKLFTQIGVNNNEKECSKRKLSSNLAHSRHKPNT